MLFRSRRSPSSYPFPFIGAGDARYFEWAEVMVRFEKAPTKSSRAAIEAEMPSAFADASWNKDLLVASSAQFVQCDITAAYGPGRKPKRRSRKHVASSAASTAFNTEIEQWLRAAHEVTPILVAFRRRDAEAGGTELSDWHAWSANQAATFMPAFATSIREIGRASCRERV